jgi:hypothetical protein
MQSSFFGIRASFAMYSSDEHLIIGSTDAVKAFLQPYFRPKLVARGLHDFSA